MTDLDLAELRRIAEAHRANGHTIMWRVAAPSPQEVLALLDRIESLEAERRDAHGALAEAFSPLGWVTDGTGSLISQGREVARRWQRAEARLARVTDDSDRQEVRQQRITDRLHKLIEEANAIYEKQAWEDRPWNEVATDMYTALAPEAAIRAVAADEREAER